MQRDVSKALDLQAWKPGQSRVEHDAWQHKPTSKKNARNSAEGKFPEFMFLSPRVLLRKTVPIVPEFLRTFCALPPGQRRSREFHPKSQSFFAANLELVRQARKKNAHAF